MEVSYSLECPCGWSKEKEPDEGEDLENVFEQLKKDVLEHKENCTEFQEWLESKQGEADGA